MSYERIMLGALAVLCAGARICLLSGSSISGWRDRILRIKKASFVIKSVTGGGFCGLNQTVREKTGVMVCKRGLL